MASLDGFV